MFGGYFLVPPDLFRKEWNDTWGSPFIHRVLKVKRIFRVSYKTILYRLEQEELGTNLWATFMGQYKRAYRKTLRRSDEPEGIEPSAFRAGYPESSRANEPEDLSRSDFQSDRLQRLVRRAVEEKKISLSKAAEVLEISAADMKSIKRSWL